MALAVTHVNDLLRLVAHAFHPPESTVILEALLRENRCVKDEELAAIVHLNQKQVRKSLSDLKTGDLIKSENKTKEERDKGEKATAHLFWYVDYKNAIDCIKYRIHLISHKYDDEKAHHVQIQAYKCATCNQRYTALQAGELAQNLWKCESCTGDVEEVSEDDSSNNVHNQQKAFHSQIASIIASLKLVEENPLPIYPRNTTPSFADSQLYLNQGGSGHSYSTASRSNAAAASFLGSTNGPMDIVVDLVGATSAPQTKNQNAQVEDKKVAPPPWLSATIDAIPKPSVEITTTNTTESGVDEETYKLYIQQYYAEMQRNQGGVPSAEGESDASTTEPAVKQEPDEDSPTAKRRRVESASAAPVVADVVEQQVGEEQVAEEEEQEASLEGWEDPMITVAGESIPFLSTLNNDEMIERMTAEEYEIYADIVLKYAAFTGQG